MAIKTSSQGILPEIDLDYLQYNEFHMSVSEKPPHVIAVTAKVKSYGIVDGIKYYDPRGDKKISVTNMDSYVANSVPQERQAEAVTAITKVQEGLGVLASIYFDVDFEGVE